MRDETFMTLMRLLPKSALSTAVGHGHPRCPLPAPAPDGDPGLRQARTAWRGRGRAWRSSGYPTFAQFFTRKLKPGLRAIDPGENVVVSPVDGAVSQPGYSENGRVPPGQGHPATRSTSCSATRRGRGAVPRRRLRRRSTSRRATTTASTRRWTARSRATRTSPGEFWPVNPRVGEVQGRALLRQRAADHVPGHAGRARSRS